MYKGSSLNFYYCYALNIAETPRVQLECLAILLLATNHPGPIGNLQDVFDELGYIPILDFELSSVSFGLRQEILSGLEGFMPQQAASTAGRQRRAWTAYEDELLRNAVNKGIYFPDLAMKH